MGYDILTHAHSCSNNARQEAAQTRATQQQLARKIRALEMQLYVLCRNRIDARIAA